MLVVHLPVREITGQVNRMISITRQSGGQWVTKWQTTSVAKPIGVFQIYSSSSFLF